MLLEATTVVAGRELEDMESRADGDDDGDHFPSPRMVFLTGTHSNDASVGNV